jgi:hypothetical protein
MYAIREVTTMRCRWLAGLIVVLVAAGGFVACSEEAPTALSATHDVNDAMQPSGASHDMSAGATAMSLDPFTFRAPLEPFQIHQLPDFKIHSNATKDIVFQRAMFMPGAGPWHTHRGPASSTSSKGRSRSSGSTRRTVARRLPCTSPATRTSKGRTRCIGRW